MNILSFPFYANLNSQDRFRRGCSGNAVFGQLSPFDRFPPFQIRRDKSGDLLDCIHIYNLNGTLYRTLIHPAVPYTLHQTQYSDFITYYGGAITGLAMPCGFYYLSLAGLYSEVFQVATDLSTAVELRWQNSKPLNGVRYGGGFVQRLFLETEILEPDYKFEEEGDLNGDEVFIRDTAKLSKLRLLESGGVPEYLIDALNAVPLHDEVTVGPFDDLGKVTAKTGWLKGACRGNVTLTFEEEQPVLWRECDSVEEAEEVDQTGFVPNLSICNGGPDTRAHWSNTGNVRCRQVEFWQSAAITEQVSKNDCRTGGVSQTTLPVTFSLPVGRFESTVSQADANAQARAYFDLNKQAYANQFGTCAGQYVFLGGGPDGVRFLMNVNRDTNGPAVDVAFEIQGDNRPAVMRIITIPAGVNGNAVSVAIDGQPYTTVSYHVISTNPATYAF